MRTTISIMRDVFIEKIYRRMHEDKNIFFLCADFSSPQLDALRVKFKDRFINVGIAEQNLINISSGLALEGFTVFAYAIAPFLTMRPYEQIRVGLSLYTQLKGLNINLIGVGAGLSYEVSGPTHHCLEDITIMRALPNFIVFSPSDWVLTQKFVNFCLRTTKPKYLRFDGKPLPAIYKYREKIRFEDGFKEIRRGKKLCLVSTGYMTHKAVKIADTLAKEKINLGVIDIFLLKPLREDLFFEAVKDYRLIISMEEGFIGKGGLDTLILDILNRKDSDIKFKGLGFKDAYVFNIGSREYLHKLNNLDEISIIKYIQGALEKI